MLREGLSDASVCVLHYVSAAVPVHARHCLLQDAVPNWNLRSCNFSVSSDASDDNFAYAAQRSSCFRSFGSNIQSRKFCITHDEGLLCANFVPCV
jgi:hypothetical protein